MLVGVIPSGSKTYEIYGDFNSSELIEGKLYYHPSTKRLFYYSSTENRSNPRTGYFPVWDGRNIYISKFSCVKYMDTDAIPMSISDMSHNITKSVADEILYKQRRIDSASILKPMISDGDNSFTQCIKGVISAMNVSMIDLVDMSNPHMDEIMIRNYYLALQKISFMRIDKWDVWINIILHLRYIIEVSDDQKVLVSYKHPEQKFDTGIVKFPEIIQSKDDALKKMIKILIIKKNINKKSLQQPGVDDYTINNLITSINGVKPLSAQLFSRFIRMADLSYSIKLYDNQNKLLFEYVE